MRERLATFGGGCFWCMQPPFDHTPGVLRSAAGYTGGQKEDPTYEEVCTGSTGHLEAVQVVFDPEQVSYAQLLDVFWRNVDPMDPEGQFGDKGSQYRTAIFYHDDEQQRLAEESKKRIGESGKFARPIATAIRPAAAFYAAEEHHQYYYRKNAAHYGMYKEASGRAPFLRRVWGEKAGK